MTKYACNEVPKYLHHLFLLLLLNFYILLNSIDVCGECGYNGINTFNRHKMMKKAEFKEMFAKILEIPSII